MSRATKRAVFNSALLVSNAFFGQGLNFLLMVLYGSFLSKEDFGALQASLANILIWLILVDLGLYNGLIGTLNATKKNSDNPLGQAVKILSRVLSIRVLGALLGTLAIFLLAWLDSTQNGVWDRDSFLRNISYAPYILGFALQQTLTPYLSYVDKQAQGVIAHLSGIVICACICVYLVFHGYSVHTLLFVQSLSAYVSTLILLYFVFVQDKSFRSIRFSEIQWQQKEPWQNLFQHSWPYAIVFAAATLWQRLDQIVAAKVFGFSLGGEYSLAVKVVAIPVLVFSATTVALFPDFQRLGTDAPEKLEIYLRAITKFLFRYGLILATLCLLGVGVILSVFFPKYLAARELLPWFIPGVWAFWMYNFTYNALFAFHKYAINVIAHILAVMIYLTSLLILPSLFGLKGIALAYDCFCISLFGLTYLGLVNTQKFRLWTLFFPFAESEKQFLMQFKERLWKKS